MIGRKITLRTKKDENDLIEAPNSFFEEITVIDVLELSDNKNILDDICKKVTKSGTLILKGIDFIDFSRLVSNGRISLEEASEYVMNLNNCNSVLNLKKYFMEKGWVVLFAGLKDSRYLIEVTRNG